jgi:hydrogenase maturation protein HypF
VTPRRFVRQAHLRYFPLPGGDAAARETWRPALALVRQAFGEDIPDGVIARFRRVPHERLVQVLGLLRRGAAAPPTSSLGRLFDAVAFLTGLAEQNDEEGHAARMLEDAAGEGRGPTYGYRLTPGPTGIEIDATEMIREIAYETVDGVAASRVSRRFHATVARMLAEAAWTAAQESSLDTVALSGGCFANGLLSEGVKEHLHEKGIGRVLTHQRVPCGDAGLALGQAYAAAAEGRAE